MERIFRRTAVTHRAQKAIQGGDCCPRRMSLLRFPWLLPVRNSFASYGASAVTRTPDRGHVAEVKNQCHGVAGSQFGFPKKPFSPLMSNRFSGSSMHMLKTIYQRCVVRMRVYAIYFSMRLGDAIDPCHLANGFEAVISYECQ